MVADHAADDGLAGTDQAGRLLNRDVFRRRLVYDVIRVEPLDGIVVGVAAVGVLRTDAEDRDAVSVTYDAVDLSMERPVALEVLRPAACADPDAALARLENPGNSNPNRFLMLRRAG